MWNLTQDHYHLSETFLCNGLDGKFYGSLILDGLPQQLSRMFRRTTAVGHCFGLLLLPLYSSHGLVPSCSNKGASLDRLRFQQSR